MQQQAFNNNFRQSDLPLMGVLTSKVVDLPEAWIAELPTFQDALKLSIQQAKVAHIHQVFASMIGIDRSSFNCMMNAGQNKRYRAFPPEKLLELEQATGNRAPMQWLEMRSKGLLRTQRTKSEREAELLAELEQLRSSK